MTPAKPRGRPPGAKNKTPEQREAARAAKRARRAQMTRPLEYSAAERQAKALLGEQGAVRFNKRAKKYKYTVGQAFVYDDGTGGPGKKVYGVIGQGTSWEEAIKDAKQRVAEYRAREEAAAFQAAGS